MFKRFKNYQNPQSYVGEYRRVSASRFSCIDVLVVGYVKNEKMFEGQIMGTNTIIYCSPYSMGERLRKDGSAYYSNERGKLLGIF